MNFLRRLSVALHSDGRPRDFLENTMSSPSFTPKILYTALLMQLSSLWILVAGRDAASDAYKYKKKAIWLYQLNSDKFWISDWL